MIERTGWVELNLDAVPSPPTIRTAGFSSMLVDVIAVATEVESCAITASAMTASWWMVCCQGVGEGRG